MTADYRDKKISELTSLSSPTAAAILPVVQGGSNYQLTLGLLSKVIGIRNVQDAAYGAVGDGSTDDSTAIQAAIDEAEAAGGGFVYFPAADYAIGTTLRIDSDGVILYGDGSQLSSLTANGDAVSVLNVGSNSTSSSGKVNDVNIFGLRFNGTAASSVYNVQIYGCTHFKMNDCDIYRGSPALQMRNCDIFKLIDNKYRGTASNITIINLIQGSSDDITTGRIFGGLVDMEGGTCKGIVFGSGGTPNEFNNMLIGGGLKIDGNDNTDNIGVEIVAGCRNTLFENVEFKELQKADIDAATNLLDGKKVFFTIDSCKMLGDSTNKTDKKILLKKPTASGSNTKVIIRGNTQIHRFDDAIHVTAGSPEIKIEDCDVSDGTNFLEITSGATPRYSIGNATISSSSVNNKRGTVLAAGSAKYEAIDGNIWSDFHLTATGSASITSGNTSVTESFSNTLDYTPTARDVTIHRTNSVARDGGPISLSSFSTTQFDINCETDPGGTANYQYSLRASGV